MKPILFDLVKENIHRVEVLWPGENSTLLDEAQRLRAKKYLEDKAVTAEQLTPDGRYIAVDDPTSWQILLIDNGKVTGCLKYADRGNGPVQIVTSGMPPAIRGSKELTDLLTNKPPNMRFVESGGWAVDHRGFDGLLLILVALALEERLGPALHLITITERGNAIKLMTRIGAKLVVPVYRDEVWKCNMALMYIDTINEEYQQLVDFTALKLTKVF